jgi:hypothetical protein
MRLICPSCHAHHSIDAWLNDADARLAMSAAAELPAEVGPVVLRYLGLFRPAQQSLRWARANKLLLEVLAWLQAGSIRRHGRDWPVTPTSLRAAIDTVLARRDKLDLPLADHAYLLSVIAGHADKAEAQAETASETQRRHGSAPAPAAEQITASQVLNAVTLLRSEAATLSARFSETMTPDQGRARLQAVGIPEPVIQQALARHFEGS